MSTIKARPTVYKGIKMRSRLEADFAQRYLDPACEGVATWEYEPQCFASSSGQYLPDFRINWPGGEDYYEVKPAASLAEKTEDEVDDLLAKMEIIWESKPQADLFLMFWQYGGGTGSHVIYSFSRRSRIWLVSTFPITAASVPPMIWYGRGQFETLLSARRSAC